MKTKILIFNKSGKLVEENFALQGDYLEVYRVINISWSSIFCFWGILSSQKR
jgi:hypothetical protein